MKRIFNILLACFLGICMIQMVNAQTEVEQANTYFKSSAYNQAIDLYEAYLEEKPTDLDALSKLAKSYMFVQNQGKALDVYAKMDKLNGMPVEDLLTYAQLLKSVGLYDAAIDKFHLYAQIHPNRGNHEIASCEVAKIILSEPVQYSVDLFDASSHSDDFGPVVFNNNVLYNSFRKDLTRKFYAKPSDRVLHDQFVSTGTKNKGLTRIGFTRGDDKMNAGVGPVQFSKQSVVYTVGAFPNGIVQVSDNDAHGSIHFGELVNERGDWIEREAFEHNLHGYATVFPAFAEQGEVLYFSSNRPGGYGGYDIYVSRKNGTGWSEPTNLGPEVNTVGNEITPFVLNEFVYFSSDYIGGLGGFDVFEYNLSTHALHNMGNGVNSPMDDIFFIKNKKEDISYVSSNRLGGKGGMDIYTLEPIMTEDWAEQKVPEAMDLDAINIGTNAENPDSKTVSSDDSKSLDVGVVANNFFSMQGAVKAHENVANNKVFFIQLASFSKENLNVNKYTKLSTLGNIYKVKKGYATKIRLGYFYDKTEASDILSQVKQRGFNDAFIVNEPLNTASLELLKMGDNKAASTTNAYNPTEEKKKIQPTTTYSAPNNISNYKIRLASYTDPLWFDIGSVKDIGLVEQWTKGDYTIFVLSGFKNINAAKSALIKAKNRGFQDAHIVEDQNGYLEKVEIN